MNSCIGTLNAPNILPGQPGLKHIIIRWNSLSVSGSVCGNVTYHLQLTTVFDETTTDAQTVSTMNLSYTFNGLSPDTYYMIIVYGSNNAGNGETSTAILRTRSKTDFPYHCGILHYVYISSLQSS